jgi:cytidylate kinase
MSNAPIVTIAALYGAGSSFIGRKVADQLEVPFLDRLIPEEAARRTGVSEEALADVDDEPRPLSERLLSNLARASTVSSPQANTSDSLELEERRLRHAIEDALAGMRTSGGVAIGRGGMVVLRTVPWALHVHLGGPREARIDQGGRLEGINHALAHERQEREDKARRSYVRRAYGVDGGNPELYHLMLDSTALPLDTCVEMIVTAARARVAEPRQTAPI